MNRIECIINTVIELDSEHTQELLQHINKINQKILELMENEEDKNLSIKEIMMKAIQNILEEIK